MADSEHAPGDTGGAPVSLSRLGLPSSQRLATEVAHILFLDLVGFSRLPMEHQARQTASLRAVVRAAPEFQLAASRGDMIGIDTGDGMALAFLRDPLAPLHCAAEISQAARNASPPLPLRMGVHSGPVSRVSDINGRDNVTGSGINMAQRVMDCGDAGHILLSSASADLVREYANWADCLLDLGDCAVKHGQRLHLYNLSAGSGIGNPATPLRLQCLPASDAAAAAARSAMPPRSSLAAAQPRSAPAPTTGALSVVLLYKRGAADDERLLAAVEAGLRAAGDTVFIDRHLKIGVEWAQEIERRIHQADAVIPILSPAAYISEMLEYEILTAHRAAQEQSGKPRLLPVRVGSDKEPLPEPLGAILNPLQYALWPGGENADTGRIVSDLLDALHRPLSIQAQTPPRESVGGAVPLDSRFYIVRTTDDAFLEAIRRRDSIVLVKGGRQIGKTSLLARGLQQARAVGARVASIDMQTLSASMLASPDSLFLALADSLADQLDLDADPREKWKPELGANTNFERFIRRQVLAELGESPLVWGLDEVDRLFPPGCAFGSEVFGLFRSWHNKRSLDPAGPWSRLTLVIAYATEAHLFITDLNQSPFNVGTRLALEDFDAAQVDELNRRYNSPLRNPAEVAGFHDLVGGQPYLVRRGLDELCSREIGLSALAATADRDEGAFGDHLRRILVTLSQDDKLSAVVRGFIMDGGSRLDSDSFFRLRSAGVLSGDTAAEAQFRCGLYQTYLSRHLLSIAA